MKVYCEDCKYCKNADDIWSRCEKTDFVQDAIKKEYLYNRPCRTKNADNNCKDFEKRVLFLKEKKKHWWN